LNNPNIMLFTPWSVLQILLAGEAIYVLVAKLEYGLDRRISSTPAVI
jgi:hypothetical protein